MIARFWEELARLDGSPCRLLECGSRRQPGQPPGAGAQARERRKDVELVGLDCQSGEGVDLVADLHNLGGIPEASFHAVLICSTLEHVRRPWVVAGELARVTRPGGLLLCATHFVFPHHPAYGGDFYRFSDEGLREIFGHDAGWECVAAAMEFPCKVLPIVNAFAHAKDWNFEAESYLGSVILCRRLPGPPGRAAPHAGRAD